MATNIKLELSSDSDDFYFDSMFIVNRLLKEMNVYPSSQKRLMMAKYLFALTLNGEEIGFITAVVDDKYYEDVLSIDLCLLLPFRNEGLANVMLPKVVEAIEQAPDYNGEFLIVEKSRIHDKDVDGIEYSDNIVLLQDRLTEINYVHPDGIMRPTRVVSSKESFGVNNKERK